MSGSDWIRFQDCLSTWRRQLPRCCLFITWISFFQRTNIAPEGLFLWERSIILPSSLTGRYTTEKYAYFMEPNSSIPSLVSFGGILKFPPCAKSSSPPVTSFRRWCRGAWDFIQVHSSTLGSYTSVWHHHYPQRHGCSWPWQQNGDFEFRRTRCENSCRILYLGSLNSLEEVPSPIDLSMVFLTGGTVATFLVECCLLSLRVLLSPLAMLCALCAKNVVFQS